MPESVAAVPAKPYLIRCEPAQAEPIYRLLLMNAKNLTQPIDALSFSDFKENMFDQSQYFYWCLEKTILALGYLGRFDQFSRSAEFGVVALQPGQGNGIPTAKALFAYGFGTLGLHRIYCTVNKDNEPCLKAIKKSGLLTREGETRQSRFVNGRFVDQVLFSRLATDKT